MSTVIATGFVVRHHDLARLQRSIGDLRRRIGRLARRAHAVLVAERTCRLVDDSVAMGREWPRDALRAAWAGVDGESLEIERTGLRRPQSDFGFELSLIPDARTGAIYGMTHCEHPSWRRVWITQPDVSEYRWWNNADRPSGIAAGRWDARGETWSRIMPSFVPADHGFSARISPTRLTHAPRDPLAHQPDIVSRKQAIARTIAIDERVRERGPTDEGREVVPLVMEAVEWLRSSAGRARHQEIVEGLRLPARIDEAIARAEIRPEGLALI